METAIRIAFYRGFVATSITQKGAMATVRYGCREVEKYLEPDGVLACENSGSSVAVSRDINAVEQAVSKIKSDSPDALARKLQVEVTYHFSELTRVTLSTATASR